MQSVIGEDNSVLNLFQEKLKYGLSDRISILVYELGFSDRYLACKISSEISNELNKLVNKDQVIKAIQSHEKELKELLLTYPTYFKKILGSICNKKLSSF